MIPAQHAHECADIVTSSEDYARRFNGEIGTWLLQVQAQIVRKLLAQKQYKSALDVGGGHGQLIEPLRELGMQVTILGSAEVCRKRIEYQIQQQQCNFTVGSLTTLAAADRSFDLTTSIRFISHCQEWQTLIHELCRVARHAVLIDYPPLLSSNLMAPLTFQIKKLIEGNTRPYSIFTHSEIAREFNKHGYRLEKRIGQFFWPMAIHRLLKNPSLSRRFEGLAEQVGLRKDFGSPVLALFVKN